MSLEVGDLELVAFIAQHHIVSPQGEGKPID